MNVIKIELIDPRAILLLEDLARLDLIRIAEEEGPQKRFSALLARLRSQTEVAPDPEEIAKEVELVRSERQKGDG